MSAILDPSLSGHQAVDAVMEAAAALPGSAQDVTVDSQGTVINEAFASSVARRERRERDLVRFVLQHSRAELELACLALGESVQGKNDETLREILFNHHRGVPPPSRLPQ